MRGGTQRGNSWIAYCRLSAAPVGRMVLGVFDVRDDIAERLSDDVCIGLQLANHAQDVRRDAAIGRKYLVESDVATLGDAGATASMVQRARTLLASGEELERRVPRAAVAAARTLPHGRPGDLRRDRGARVIRRSNRGRAFRRAPKSP